MKKPLLLSVLIAASSFAVAQSYQDKAAEVQKIVTAESGPEFALKDVPTQYANESAVVLAQSFKIQRTSSTRFKYLILSATVTKRVTTITTYHERVKINDKAALDEYSTVEYQKKLDKSVSVLWTKYVNSHDTYIGAKIIKPNGQEVIVNTGEEVLLKNTGKDQQGKLAIPGLQVGDILDYYVSTNDQNESGLGSISNSDLVFTLYGDHPILNYSLLLQYDRKSTPFVLCANGAPNLELTTGENRDKIYSLKLKDLPKYQSQMWSSPFRQLPYIEIGTGAMNRNVSTADLLEDLNLPGFTSNKQLFEKRFNDVFYPFDKEPEKILKDYYDNHKAYKAAPLDSTMKVFFNAWKYFIFDNYNKNQSEQIADLNYRKIDSRHISNYISRLLTDMDINHDILLVSSRESSSLENAFNMNDFDAIIRINNGDKPLYMSFNDPLSQFNEIPARFQGEQALSLKPRRRTAQRYDFAESSANLPVTGADQNFMDVKIAVTIPADNMLKLKLDRRVKEGGQMRFGDQRAMVSPAEVDNAIMLSVKGEPLAKRLSKNSDTRKLSDAFQNNMTRSATEMKKIFISEVKSEYDQEPQQISDMKIINTGLTDVNPVFEFASSFTLDNLVQKAGGNYIVETGKLIGGFIKLKQEDRKRTGDVYMPFARSFKYTISVAIPKGYRVKGVEELNKQKRNKTGSFVSAAALTGNTLNITVSRTYSNNFEKAADWPSVTELIDAASEFNDQKILLEKES